MSARGDDLDPAPGRVFELEAERDAYAAEARALREAVAAGHAREVFLNDTVAQLRTALAAAERRTGQLADALTRAGVPLPALAAVDAPLALAA